MSFIKELGNVVNVITDDNLHFLVCRVSHGDYVVSDVAQVQVVSALNEPLTILTDSSANQVVHPTYKTIHLTKKESTTTNYFLNISRLVDYLCVLVFIYIVSGCMLLNTNLILSLIFAFFSWLVK